MREVICKSFIHWIKGEGSNLEENRIEVNLWFYDKKHAMHSALQ